MYITQTAKLLVFLLLGCVLSQVTAAADGVRTPLLIQDILQQEEKAEAAQAIIGIAEPQAPQVHLYAMYGVGKQRVIELGLNGRRYVFLPNHIWPLGDSMGATQLRFVRADQRCASFYYKDQPLQACIAPKGGLR